MARALTKNFNQWTPFLVRFFAKVNKNGPVHPTLGTNCWVWTGGLDKDGYGRVLVNGLSCRAHRLSWEVKNGEAGDLSVLHKCDNMVCVNPAHLFLGTQADNCADMVSKGRQSACRGEDNPKAKLTDDLVREIRRRHALGGRGNGYRALSREFGVSHPVVFYVVKRKVWRHVT